MPKSLLCLSALLLTHPLFLVASHAAGEWPQWRGPLRNGHVPNAPVLNSLPTEPKVVWKKNVGPGHSSPIVVSNRLIYLDAQGGKEVAHCVNTLDGKETWSFVFSDTAKDEFGEGPRSTPFVDGDRVYLQSMRGDFFCLGLTDGKPLWSASFEKEFGVVFVGMSGREGAAMRRGNNGSGIVHRELVYVPVGSTNGATLVAFDKRTGRKVWKSLNDEAAYSSLVVTPLAGVEQLVAFTADALCGLGLGDGKLLWRVPLKTDAKRHAVTPLIIGDTVIVSSHTIGLVAVGLSREKESLQPKELWANKTLRISIASMVHAGDHLYGQGPDKNFICVDPSTGQVKWSQPDFGEKPLVGYSSTLVVGNNLLILNDRGELVLIAADSSKYRELGRFQACGNAWAFPAWFQGNLVVRDKKGEMICYEMIPPTVRVSPL